MPQKDQSSAVRALVLDSRDDVATLIDPARENSPVAYTLGEERHILTAMQAIPAYHKIALREIKKGAPLRKYGETIGVAIRDIPAGAHVHTHNLCSAPLVREEGHA